MIALVSALFMMEFIMNRKVFKWIASAFFILAWATLAEGELSALAWLLAIIVLTLNYINRPEPLPPEYIPKRHRSSTMSIIPACLLKYWWSDNTSVIKPSSVLRLGSGRFNHRGPFRYQLYRPAKRRAAARKRNHHSAMSLRLVMITCIMAASIGCTTAFDSGRLQANRY
jgi:hypothetical protein